MRASEMLRDRYVEVLVFGVTDLKPGGVGLGVSSRERVGLVGIEGSVCL